MYKQIFEPFTSAPKWVQRIADGVVIPFDAESIDYQNYLAWLEEGNEPTPADPLPPPDPKLIGIEFDGVMCSATRDDQNGLVAVIIAYQLQGENFQSTEFHFVNGNTIVLTAQNVAQFMTVWIPFRQSFFIPEAA